MRSTYLIQQIPDEHYYESIFLKTLSIPQRKTYRWEVSGKKWLVYGIGGKMLAISRKAVRTMNVFSALNKLHSKRLINGEAKKELLKDYELIRSQCTEARTKEWWLSILLMHEYNQK